MQKGRMMKTIGIDPGKDGFISCIEGNMIIGSWPIPTIKITKKGKRDYDVNDMCEILIEYKPELIVIEQPQMRRKQSMQSVASNYRGIGLWEGMFVTLRVPYVIVNARTWQKLMHAGMPGDDPKAKSILAVKRLFPGIDLRKSDKARVDHDGKADSILLAIYGQRISKE